MSLQVQSWLYASNNTGILNTCTRLWLTEPEQVTLVDSIEDLVRSSVQVPEFDKHPKKAGRHIGRNVMEITIKMKTIVRKPLRIKIIRLYLRNSDKFVWIYVHTHIHTHTRKEKKDFLSSKIIPVGLGCRIHWLLLCRGVRPSPTQRVSWYETKQSDGEVPVMIVLLLVCWVLWHINLCRLFNAKSIFM